jgi:hypothetical protein
MVAPSFTRGDFFAAVNTKFKKCLDPTLLCSSPAIRAHSIQNATSLDLIAEENHVYEIGLDASSEPPKCSFRRVGRKNASTFSGFCDHHDAEIFRPIELKPIHQGNAEQLFLLAYRSITRELHTVLQAAHGLQVLAARERVLVPSLKNQPTRASWEELQHLIKSWGIWKHRAKYYDAPLTRQRFEALSHWTFAINDRPPVLAASSFFSIDNKPWGEPFKGVSLNVVPTSSTTTLVVASFPTQHKYAARRYLAPVFMKRGEQRLLALSKLLLDRAENFFLSPSHVDAWKPSKKAAIESAFGAMILGSDTVSDPSELSLF